MFCCLSPIYTGYEVLSTDCTKEKDGALLRRLMDITIYDYFSSWFS